MVILIAGGTHTGKTMLAQRLLDLETEALGQMQSYL